MNPTRKLRFEGIDLKVVLALEISAGCARLSAACSTVGLSVLGLDQPVNRHLRVASRLNVDLAANEGLAFLWDIRRTFPVCVRAPCTAVPSRIQS